MKKREMASAAAVGVLIVLVYIAGFHFRIIHTVIAGIASFSIALFPTWIVLEYTEKETQ